MDPIRPARPGRTAWIVAKTIAVMVVFWFTFLFLLPIGISIVEIELGIQRFPPQLISAALLLLVFTLLGIWAALTMAAIGQGTPAWFDAARELVVTGPYAYARHPLVMAALGQGVGVGIALGSVPVLVYVAGAFATWYFFVRPGEEQRLAARFGEPWTQYARAVRGFRPRLTPYRRTTDRGSRSDNLSP